MNTTSQQSVFSIARIGLFSAILGAIVLSFAPIPEWYTSTFQHFYKLTPNDAFLASKSSFQALSILWLVIVLWLTEALPLPVTALLPAIVTPFFTLLQVKQGTTQELPTTVVLSNYASSIVFLFLGGFILAQALTRHKVEQQWASWLLSKKLFSTSPQRIVLGIMIITAFISMWVNNTASAAMIIPLAIGIANSLQKRNNENGIGNTENFTTIAILSVAWSASIGGIGTLVGSAPNGIAVGNLKQATGIVISFTDWFIYGFPIMIMLLPIAWKMLFWLMPVKNIQLSNNSLMGNQDLQKSTSDQNKVVAIFILTALLWISVPFLKDISNPFLQTILKGFSEWTIPLICCLLFFIIPESKSNKSKLLNWNDVQSIDWGTLLLFGGGLALSSILFQTGTMEVCTNILISNVGTVSEPVLSLFFGLFVNFATELTSNIALTSIISPVAISIAKQLSLSVEPILIIVAISASFSFMLPIGTPPNAIAYSTGKVPLSVMIKCGFLMNIISTIVACVWILFVYSLKNVG
jgi:sodium-dependent dicarboxylate transporter 2/3/5